MRGLYACVTRGSEEGGPSGGWVPGERISVEECIRAYTLGSAFAEFEEERKGTLAPGRFADLVVLSRDVTRARPQEILRTEALLTVVNGRVAFEKK